jgi:peroxiredoxin/predicted 2-oxoglutarate/Fe(II)-dependent dioxygenase YbiX
MATTNIKLQIGGPAPWFEARSSLGANFRFDTIAGRYVVLCFFGSAAVLASHRVLEAILERRSQFEDRQLAFFGVSIDPDDERYGRVPPLASGMHVLWDFDRRISRLFGIARTSVGDPPTESYRPSSLLLDERLRVVAILPLDARPEQHVDRLMEAIAALPPLGGVGLGAAAAPILTVPRILEPEVCSALIRHYEEHGGGESGVMRDVDGKTVGVHDFRFKRRRDQEILDERLRKACMVRVHDRLLPELAKAFQFRATRIERYIVACYAAEVGGHFRAHRDNTTRATAHRRFAVSLVLNAGDFEGGDLRFPEFGPQHYCPPTGGAIVFSCSLLHEVTPVTRGVRYAFLPFLYDETAAQIRQENARFLQGKPSAP